MFRLVFILIATFSTSAYSQEFWSFKTFAPKKAVIASKDVAYYLNSYGTGNHSYAYQINKSENCFQSFDDVFTNESHQDGCVSGYNLFFTHPDTGFLMELCAGFTTVLQTNDGGHSWDAIGGCRLGESLFFRGGNLGYFLGADTATGNGVLIHKVGIGPPTSWPTFNTFHYASYSNTFLHFINDSTGFVSLYNHTFSEEIIFKTTDWAQSWTEVLATSDKTFLLLNKMGFVNDTTGFIIGNHGLAWVTNDAGDSWNPINLGVSEPLNDIEFVNDSTGYIAGNSGTLIKTNNCGASWNLVNFPDTNDLHNITSFDDGTCYIQAQSRLYVNRVLENSSELNEELRNRQVQVHPNPTIDKVLFKIPLEYTDFTINLYNAHGECILQIKNQRKVNLASLPSGIYFAKILTNTSTFYSKIVLCTRGFRKRQ